MQKFLQTRLRLPFLPAPFACSLYILSLVEYLKALISLITLLTPTVAFAPLGNNRL